MLWNIVMFVLLIPVVAVAGIFLFFLGGAWPFLLGALWVVWHSWRENVVKRRAALLSWLPGQCRDAHALYRKLSVGMSYHRAAVLADRPGELRSESAGWLGEVSTYCWTDERGGRVTADFENGRLSGKGYVPGGNLP